MRAFRSSPASMARAAPSDMRQGQARAIQAGLLKALLCCSAAMLPLSPVQAQTQAQPAPTAAAAANATAPAQAFTVTPAPTGLPTTSRAHELAARGYVEEEFVLSGKAADYSTSGQRQPDGKWAAALRTPATPYETRLLVRRPQDPARFNGTVVVEWLNTSLGVDLDGIWIAAREELLREGYAWVGVSAEQDNVGAIQKANPSRYARARIQSRYHGFDVYTDAAKAVRDMAARWSPAGKAGAQPIRLIGAGYSQAGSILFTYINTFQPRAKAFDAYYLRGAAWMAPPLNDAELSTFAFDFGIRADLGVPVMMVQSEAEIEFSRQASKTVDTDWLRYWEVAGTTHFDQYMQDGARSLRGMKETWVPARCTQPVNTMPLQHVDHAAIHGLRAWMATGTPPPKAPRMQRGTWGFVQDDASGHAIGGLRLPEMQARIARYSIFGNWPDGDWSMLNAFSCLAGGGALPLPAQEIRARYADKGGFLRAYKQAADKLLNEGFLRPADHAAMIERARAVRLPR